MIVQDGWLVFKPKDPFEIQSVLPQAHTISLRGEEMTAITHNLETVQVLRNMGVNAPSPVNHGWEYTGVYKDRVLPHQRDTVGFLMIHRRGFVLNQMGTMKTCCAIWAAEYLMQQDLLKRVLIVAPRSCLHKVWGDEIFRTTMHRTAAILQGSRNKRRDLFASSADYLIINHDGLSIISDLVAKDMSIGLIIVDESAAYRNGTTQKYKHLKSCLRPDMRLWMMSGSPCPNAPTDAWAQARLVRPDNVPPYFTSFKRMTMDKISMFKWVPRNDSDEIVYAAMQPAVRYAKDECIDLPPVTYQDRECDLTPEQKRLFKDMQKHLHAEHAGGSITAANAAVKLIKLLQICCGAVYDNDKIIRVSEASPRLEVLKELIEESERKVIVWVPFIAVLEHLVTYLQKEYGHESTMGVSGSVTDNARREIFGNFTDDHNPLRILVAHPKTAAHGLNLVSANTSIWYAPFFSTEMYMQANERINRPGQKYDMTVVHLAATALEWGVYDAVKTKSDRQNKILSLYKNEIIDITA